MDIKEEILKDALYKACTDLLETDRDDAYDQIFTQDEFLGLDVVSDMKKLVQVIGALTHERLLIPLSTPTGSVWRLRPRAEAAKYHSLTRDQALVYESIDVAGAEGIWQQDLRKKTNIHDATVRKLLKDLETKRLIASFTSVENPQKRRWIKASLKPSAKATGGPWFSDGDLDESFIQLLTSVVYSFIKNAGSWKSHSGSGSGSVGDTSRLAAAEPNSAPLAPKKGVTNGKASEAALAAQSKGPNKRPVSAMTGTTEEEDSAPHKSRRTASTPVLLPLPSGYTNYLTLPDITSMVAKSNVTRGTKLQDADIKQLLDVLVFDGRVDEIKIGPRLGYRPTRVGKCDPSASIDLDGTAAEDAWEPYTNGLMTAPCGRCPVFDLCEEGGAVWAGGCEFFDQFFA